MHRVPTARWLSRALRIGDVVPATGLPVFLCPAIGLVRADDGRRRGGLDMNIATWTPRRRFNHTETADAADAADGASSTPSTLLDADQAQVLERAQLPGQPQLARSLPITCSGCGAFAQTTDAQQLGHFDLRSKRVRQWLHPQRKESSSQARESNAAQEDRIVDNVLKTLAPETLKELGLSAEALMGGEDARAVAKLVSDKPPVCDRCHDLMHHSTANRTAKLTMHHPTVESLRETIEESPYKYNHIYHIIDAADFPMSLIPRLNVLLGDIPLRSRNRRSRSARFQNDRKTEMSFIITRGDLLGPTKEIVDSMMPYLRDVLRDALGRLGGRVRLGNLKCVSARRGWWTKDVKEDVWNRGGAGWMVGKVNVGKSQLFEAIYPKGRMSEGKKVVDQDRERERGRDRDRNAVSSTYAGSLGTGQTGSGHAEPWHDLDVGELLPPAQPATNFPEMPVVSSLPGTTASPIRVPFGNGKGELIDLPGLARSNLELFVKEEDQQSLIMKKRIVPEQLTVKSGKSVILGGGLIRITPRTPDMIFLMYNFTPLEEHLTMTEKAIAFQDQTRESVGVASIMLPGVGDKMKHAGTFKLTYDVTKARAGPLTRKNAVGLQVDRLPFRVLSVDILIEGVGYVEIVAQVRSRDYERWSRMQRDRDRALAALEDGTFDAGRGDGGGGGCGAMSSLSLDGDSASAGTEDRDPFEEMMQKRRDIDGGGPPPPVKDVMEVPEPEWPAVDVFSPEGRFVGARRPIQGWLNNKPRVLAEHKKSRPRRSMKGAKKRAKETKRGGK
ncbi:hypothetical protein E4U43_005695 [Claviceps pusilla]|uniref:Genetic interactor of prohibitins 3, mitochondrial n=1 Tax=Claviceps pusilla TaxID=123648 RepID=A0A9P7SW64_9HYPO|nr:hypothetical protein E4U43_005695 [Claviceps pusilla]